MVAPSAKVLSPAVDQPALFGSKELRSLVPVHDMPPGGHVVRPSVLIVQIVGVLPNIETEDGFFSPP